MSTANAPLLVFLFFFFQAEDGIRDFCLSRGLGDVYKRQCHTEFKFDTFIEGMDYFKQMINLCKQMNYAKYKSEQYEDFKKQLQELVAERSV